jgi:GntR family transcriptional regulator, rspAB operon transcriptional repressor
MMETDRVYEGLLKRIIALELEPGSTVTQAYLSELLECGRTPLREAIQRLMVEGLVVHTPNRGISIAPLDIRHYAQIEEAYLFLNVQTVRLAALRRTEAQVADLQAILDSAMAILEQGRFMDAAPLDVDFHCLLAAAGNNQFLADAAARMEKLAMRFVTFADVSDSADVHRQVWNYHQKILDAVRDQDPDETERAFRTHMEIAKRQLLGLLGMLEPAQAATRG